MFGSSRTFLLSQCASIEGGEKLSGAAKTL